MQIRTAQASDAQAIWDMLKPVFRAGETYAVDPTIGRAEALGYWLAEHALVIEEGGRPLGTYYIQRNRPGGGAHYCNCGFVTARGAEGRGLAQAMLSDALVRAKGLGFTGMVFNFVVASNTRAVALWERNGFETVGRVPGAFQAGAQGASHGRAPASDALVMFRAL